MNFKKVYKAIKKYKRAVEKKRIIYLVLWQ